MNTKELSRISSATLEKIKTTTNLDCLKNEYYGFYDAELIPGVDICLFNCADDPRCADLLYNNYFEPTSMLVASVGARLNKTFIDIGAHTGMYSLMAAKINKNLVIMSFEPNFLAFSRLIMHVKINNIKNIQLLNFAVSNTKNNLNLNWSNPKGFGWISSGGHVSDHDVVHTYNSIVRCLTLDSLIIENPAFIKIDVEGHELNVIEGAINTIQKSFPDILIESFNEDNCKKVSKLLGPKYHFFKILEKEKYLQKTYEIQPASVESGNFNYFCTIHPESYLKELSQFKIKLI